VASDDKMSSEPTTAELMALVKSLQQENATIRASYEARIAALEETIAGLTHENALLKRRLFGNKTERLRTTEMQLTLKGLHSEDEVLQKQLDETIGSSGSQVPGSSDDSDDEKPPKKAPKGRRDLSASELPRTEVTIDDPHLAARGKLVGHDTSYQLMRLRGGFMVLVKHTAKYKIPKGEEAVIVAAPSRRTLFPRGLLHPSTVAYLLAKKFALGVPHYRLERHLESEGVPLHRSLMCRYVEEAGGTLGATVCQAMWKDAIETAAVISTDATGAMIQPAKEKVKGLRSSCKKSHFFTAIADRDHVLFAFAERHTSDFVKRLFEGFNGYLQCDASNVYDVLERSPPDMESTTLVGCWAHCRRYFFEAALCRYPVGVQGLMRIRAIYAVEESFGKVPPSKRKQLRNKHMRPLIEDFFAWVASMKAEQEGRNYATKALGYASNQQARLERVLDDGKLLLDNTRSERSLRTIVVGRKNWMFYGSDTHAESAAAIFTLIASCRLHALDPTRYLDEIMRLLPYWPSDRFLELAPKNWAATRARLDPRELDTPLGPYTIPARA